MNVDLADSDPIVSFYLGRSRDNKDRRLEDIWAWDIHKLEGTHDYIQWLFPLRKRSQFNPKAPTLTSVTIEAFRNNDELKRRLRISLDVMLKFYGLESTVGKDGIIEISKAPDFDDRSLEWLTTGNHNFLRVTRILKSLQILGLSDWSHALFMCLNEIYGEYSNEIGERTLSFWKSASGT
jgi:hypothetical protein